MSMKNQSLKSGPPLNKATKSAFVGGHSDAVPAGRASKTQALKAHGAKTMTADRSANLAQKCDFCKGE